MKKKIKKTPKPRKPKSRAESLQKLAELSSERFDYCENHQIIMDAQLRFMAKRGYPPTQAQIAEEVGLSRVTVGKHCKDIRLTNIAPDYRVFTPRVLSGLLARASKGDPAAAKLWFQVVEEWLEKRRNELTGTDGKRLFDGLDELSEEDLDREYEQLCREMPQTAQ